MPKIHIIFDAEGQPVDTTLPYKCAILVGRNFTKKVEDPVVGSWKMHFMQRLMVTSLYTTIIHQESKPSEDMLLKPKQMPFSYGGFPVEVDQAVPENEAWFMHEGKVRVKIINLQVPDVET